MKIRFQEGSGAAYMVAAMCKTVQKHSEQCWCVDTLLLTADGSGGPDGGTLPTFTRQCFHFVFSHCMQMAMF